ncbi:MAG: hypothetical protein JSV86_20950 [Gemmatimonadota bacterium]|nr:MAG: hypothetical protein JSV86_20950 [Gemmatimonadota bacterium]
MSIYACSESTFEPIDVRPLDPPQIYETWWAEVAACVSVAAPFDRVSWYEAERLINRETGTDHIGAWLPPHNIYIRTNRLLYIEGVKHEMVHDLLQTRNHYSELFVRCAGV